MLHHSRPYTQLRGFQDQPRGEAGIHHGITLRVTPDLDHEALFLPPIGEVVSAPQAIQVHKRQIGRAHV
jgi:hypothetical protein